ncbi:MAG: acetyltransferase [Alphaproteobacteria bacterium]|nr:acetyltransferase [Alphaproteobacteria bacterium]
MTKRLVFIGGGGLAKEMDEIASLNGFEIVGYTALSEDVLDRPFLGPMESLLERRDSFDAVIIAFGAVNRKTMARRAEVVTWVQENHLPSLPLISPRASISKGVKIADGSFVAHGAVVSVDVTVGAFSIINYNAMIGHETTLDSNVIVAPGAFVGGRAHIGANTLLGAGANILQGLDIGSNAIVSVGSAVLRDVPSGATVLPVASRVL